MAGKLAIVFALHALLSCALTLDLWSKIRKDMYRNTMADLVTGEIPEQPPTPLTDILLVNCMGTPFTALFGMFLGYTALRRSAGEKTAGRIAFYGSAIALVLLVVLTFLIKKAVRGHWGAIHVIGSARSS